MAAVTDFQIGDIVMSALDEATFASQHGGIPTTPTQLTWVLCDGRDVSNSQYQKVSGQQYVPDLVGRYPRGLDLTGKAGVPTPSLGGTMSDNFASHNHVLAGGDRGTDWGIMGDCQGGGDNQVARTGYGGNLPTSSTGGNETRPKTTIVNFFIRIN